MLVIGPLSIRCPKAFFLSRVSVGFLFQYFCIFIFSMMQEKMQQDECMHIYYYFRATIVNIPMCSYTPQNYLDGALRFMMQQTNFFCNANAKKELC